MEKKTYRQPQIDIHTVMTTTIIATSPQNLEISDTETTTQEAKSSVFSTFEMESEE